MLSLVAAAMDSAESGEPDNVACAACDEGSPDDMAKDCRLTERTSDWEQGDRYNTSGGGYNTEQMKWDDGVPVTIDCRQQPAMQQWDKVDRKRHTITNCEKVQRHQTAARLTWVVGMLARFGLQWTPEQIHYPAWALTESMCCAASRPAPCHPHGVVTTTLTTSRVTAHNGPHPLMTNVPCD